MKAEWVVNVNKIIKIYWNRVNLILETEKPIVGDVFLQNDSLKLKLPVSDNKIKLNITAVSQGEMLEKGDFSFVCNGERFTLCDSLISELDSFSRIFKYRKGFCAVLIDFSIDESQTLCLNCDYYMQNKKYKKGFLFSQNSRLRGKIGILLRILVPFCLNLFYKFLRLFKSKEKTVLFYSENSTEPIGNLKAEYEYFKTLGDVKTVGCFINTHEGKKLLKLLKAIPVIAKADIVVVDNYVSIFGILEKPDNQRFVQLWHAGVGFKSVGYARFGKEYGAHPFRSSHRKYDCVIVDNEELIDIYQEVFAVSREIIKPLGMPRLEGYLSKDSIEKAEERLFSQYSNLKDKKIVLFAPTFRGASDKAYYDYDKIDLSVIYDYCKENGFAFVIKMHPFVQNQITIPEEYSDLIFDYTECDINDLIYISDIMITDYSSCAYEFSFFERPLIFYRYDKSLYEYLRPVHSLDAFSSKQVETSDFKGLMQALNEFKNVDISQRYKNMRKRPENCRARIAEEILKDI